MRETAKVCVFAAVAVTVHHRRRPLRWRIRPPPTRTKGTPALSNRTRRLQRPSRQRETGAFGDADATVLHGEVHGYSRTVPSGHGRQSEPVPRRATAG